MRDFYANAAYDGSATKAWIRGKTVVYTPDRINIILQVDRASSHEKFLKFKRDVTYAEVCAISSPKMKEMPEPHKPFYFTREELTQEGKA